MFWVNFTSGSVLCSCMKEITYGHLVVFWAVVKDLMKEITYGEVFWAVVIKNLMKEITYGHLVVLILGSCQNFSEKNYIIMDIW